MVALDVSRMTINRALRELTQEGLIKRVHGLGSFVAETPRHASLIELQEQAWPVPEEFHAQAYTCVFHGIGMCDEYPQVTARFRGPNRYDCVLEAGMVLCVESYIGAVGESDGVKLEQMVLITDTGTELLSAHPWDERFLD